MIASASMLGDPVYTGVVDSVTSSNVNFASGVDENNATIYPFAGSNVFNKDVQLPILTANAAGSSVTISYPGGFDSTGTGFAANNPPAIIIDAPSSGGVASEANATINSDGEVTAVTVSAGSGYTDAPVVTLIGGPHFLRNTTVGQCQLWALLSDFYKHPNLTYPRLFSTCTRRKLKCIFLFFSGGYRGDYSSTHTW